MVVVSGEQRSVVEDGFIRQGLCRDGEDGGVDAIEDERVQHVQDDVHVGFRWLSLWLWILGLDVDGLKERP